MRGRLSRDTVIFLIGIAGIFHETLVSTNERPFLLALFGFMLGLPPVFHIDEMRKRSQESGGPGE